MNKRKLTGKAAILAVGSAIFPYAASRQWREATKGTEGTKETVSCVFCSSLESL